MIGLGGVFPVYAGIQKRAPQWAREHGLEWLYRLIQEPRRLWKRYGSTIPLFVFLAARQLFQHEGSMVLRSRLSKIS
jgi:N-acetylglucosaminyldiphosphoundecaprenol N-acetyl-beta-D-mannosaminyltransferase